MTSEILPNRGYHISGYDDKNSTTKTPHQRDFSREGQATLMLPGFVFILKVFMRYYAPDISIETDLISRTNISMSSSVVSHEHISLTPPSPMKV